MNCRKRRNLTRFSIPPVFVFDGKGGSSWSVVNALLRKLADNSDANSLANRLRRRRANYFREFLAPLPRPLRILDVGGTEDFWRKTGLADLPGIEVTLLNLTAEPVTLPGFVSVAGSACDLSRFRDGEFDVAFSNSVIEHVGTRENQAAMASEMRRVGKHFFVQTPARHFPIEPHFLFPFFAVLPNSVRIFLVRHFNLGWYAKVPDRAAAAEFLRNFTLLSYPEVSNLFPSATIARERFCGLTKSYLAHS